MRVTENRLMDLSAVATERARDAAAKAGRSLTTGVAVEQSADDPTAWATAKAAQARVTVGEGHAQAIATAKDQLGQTDDVLGDLGELLRRAQELGVQMANGHMNATDRANAAEELGQLRTSAIALADRKGPDGSYLLAGAATVAPFDPSGVYQGAATDRTAIVGEGQQTTIDVTGRVLTAASGVDILAVLDTMRTAMTGNDVAGIQTSLTDLGAGIDQVASARTTVGVRVRALDDADTTHRALAQHLGETIDRAVGADPIEAASSLAKAAQALEVAKAAAQKLQSILERG